MKEWWKRRKAKTRKHRKNNNDYTLSDLLVDILFWVPEVIVLPLRVLFWLVRGAVRSIGHIFDMV